MPPFLYEDIDDYVVSVNHYPFHREELWNEEKGIVRVYGRDGEMEKINSIRYPKRYYTEEYIQEHILPKYNDCPRCTIGTLIEEDEEDLWGELKNGYNKYKKYIIPSIAVIIVGVIISVFVYRWYVSRQNLITVEETS